MVAHSVVFYNGSLLKKFQATVINDIFPEVLFFSAVAAMVSAVSILTPHKLFVSNLLLSVLGTVLGLVISFRTSSAYERYQDGRKLWTNISIASRNLGQMIWIHIPNKRNTPNSTELKSIIEKKTMINLLQGFTVALKHFLRGENGIYYQDLYPLISFLPRYSHLADVGSDDEMLPMWQASEDDANYPYRHSPSDSGIPRSMSPASTPSEMGLPARPTNNKRSNSWFSSLTLSGRNEYKEPFDPEKALPSVNVHRPLKPSRSPPKTTMFDYFPFLLIFKWMFRRILGRKRDQALSDGRNILGRRRKPQLGDSNVPLEITLFLSNYVNYVLTSGIVQPSIAAGLVSNLTMLQDTLSNLERIATTPLPFAYQAHLRMSLWIYLFLLPFQICQAFGWLTIPAVAFASFLLLGFLEIGQEIENPFNYDMNDLDLDGFCLAIQRELHEITAHTSPHPEDFIYSMWNQPFAPADRRTARELVGENGGKYVHVEHGEGVEGVRKVLLKGWRDVDSITRN